MIIKKSIQIIVYGTKSLTMVPMIRLDKAMNSIVASSIRHFLMVHIIDAHTTPSLKSHIPINDYSDVQVIFSRRVIVSPLKG